MVESSSNSKFEPDDEAMRVLYRRDNATIKQILDDPDLCVPPGIQELVRAQPDIHRDNVFCDGILLLRDPPAEEVLTRLASISLRKKASANTLRQQTELQRNVMVCRSLSEAQLVRPDSELKLTDTQTKESSSF